MKLALKRTLWSLVVVAALAAVAAPKLLPWLKSARTQTVAGATAAPRSATKGGGGALRVTTVTLEPQGLAETIVATGTLRAEEGIELQAEVSGKVIAINFSEGSRVRKGDLLLKINDADLRATLARATFRKQLAELKEKRLALLLRDGGAKQEDYDTAMNEVHVQQAEMALVEAQIAKTEIRAPFDGVIGLRFVSEGSFILATSNATTRIATLQAVDNLKVDFSVPEKYAGRIRVGSPVRFTVAGGDHEFTGEIYALEPRIDIATRTVLIRALCPNPQGRLLPGAFANVEFTLATLENALLVPSIAVIPGLSEKNVYIVVDGKAVRRPVQTGTRTETSVHVLSGLKAGDRVITSGIQQLRAGLAVSVASPADRVSPGAPSAADPKVRREKSTPSQ